jgi:hypothetical protein
MRTLSDLRYLRTIVRVRAEQCRIIAECEEAPAFAKDIAAASQIAFETVLGDIDSIIASEGPSLIPIHGARSHA